jgi:hypothetical protein
MACTPLGSVTPILQLCKPVAGEDNWTDAINANFTILDSLFAGMNNQVFGVATTGTAIEAKTIIAGAGIVVTPATGSITIAATGAALLPAGAAHQVYGIPASGTGVEPKTITAGAGITVTPAAGSITITNSAAGLPAGAANQVYGIPTTGTGVEPKTVAAGAGITVTPAAGLLTVASPNAAALTGAANQVFGVPTSGTGIEAKTITAGANITITPAAGSITIASPSAGFPAGAPNQVFGLDSGAGTTVEPKTLAAGAGISISPGAGIITITNTVASANAPTGIGTARLIRNSTTQIQLNQGVIPLRVSGIWTSRPITSPITLSNATMAANTAYYIYAVDSGGATVLEFSATGHSTDGNFGVEVKSTDVNRTLVGAVYMNPSGQFQNGVTGPTASPNSGFLGVRSWYNRAASLGVQVQNSTGATTGGASFGELDSDMRIVAFCWADDLIHLGYWGNSINSSAGNTNYLGIAVDVFTSALAGFVVATTIQTAGGTITTQGYPAAISGMTSVSEGAHVFSLVACTTGGTATWCGNNTPTGPGATTGFSVALR